MTSVLPVSRLRLEQAERNALRQRSVWNATTSLASSPVWIAVTIGAGSTDQAAPSTQGMCVKWASVASGRCARTSAGAT